VVRTPGGSYLSWGDWRSSRRRRRTIQLTCPTCWGQKVIYEPFLGGKLMPVICECCRGTGRV
jgi:hypothetical protein